MGLAPGIILLLILLLICAAVGVVALLRRDSRNEREEAAEARIRELEGRLHQLEDVVLAMGAEVRQLGGEALTPVPALPATQVDALPAGLSRSESTGRDRLRSTT